MSHDGDASPALIITSIAAVIIISVVLLITVRQSEPIEGTMAYESNVKETK